MTANLVWFLVTCLCLVIREVKSQLMVESQIAANTKGYIGCYMDSWNRDLSYMAADWANMTIEWCVNTCYINGYRYAGTETANQCFCGNSYGSQGPSVNCTMTCSGNPNETCGGPWSNSVYDTMAYLGYLGCFSFYECKVQKTYVGCFADSWTRDLSYLAADWTNMTIEWCMNTCSTKGYRYAGVESGNQCFCGDSYGSQGTSSYCTIPCSGNANEICGGAWAISVYSTLHYIKDKQRLPVLADSNLFSMTVQSCIKTCKIYNFRLASLQAGHMCICMNSLHGACKKNKCNLSCSGNQNQTCGGYGSNSVYNLSYYLPSH